MLEAWQGGGPAASQDVQGEERRVGAGTGGGLHSLVTAQPVYRKTRNGKQCLQIQMKTCTFNQFLSQRKVLANLHRAQFSLIGKLAGSILVTSKPVCALHTSQRFKKDTAGSSTLTRQAGFCLE